MPPSHICHATVLLHACTGRFFILATEPMPTPSADLFGTSRAQSWLTQTVLSIVFASLMLFAATVQATVIFAEDFNGPTNLDAKKWTVKVAGGDPNSPYYGTSHPAAISFASGRMNVAVPGGANGYMGIPDGSNFTPIGATTTGDYEVTIGVEELLRQQTGTYKDNSGVSLVAGDRYIGLLGNYAGYFTGYSYGAYHKHRIQAAGPSGNCVLNESLGLNILYAVELRIARVGGNVKMGYKLAGQPWVDTPCGVQTGAVSPYFQITSGDGGGTTQNGQFTAAVDYFQMTDTSASSPPSVLIPATSFLNGQNVALASGTALVHGADTLLNAPPYGSVANAAEWNINVPTTGNYELFAEYAAATSRPVVISFNGNVAFASALTATTGGWNPADRQTLSQGFVQLTAGSYTMRVASNSVFPHIRGFTLVGPVAVTPLTPTLTVSSTGGFQTGSTVTLSVASIQPGVTYQLCAGSAAGKTDYGCMPFMPPMSIAMQDGWDFYLTVKATSGTTVSSASTEVRLQAATTPIVESISPSTVFYGVPSIFTVKGKNLSQGLGFTISDCEYSNYELESTSSTERYFKCTPYGNPGVKAGLVKTAPSGTVINSFSVNMVKQVLPAVYVNANQNAFESGDTLSINMSAYAEGTPNPFDLYLVFDTPSGSIFKTETGYSQTAVPALSGTTLANMEWANIFSLPVSSAIPAGNYSAEAVVVDQATQQVINRASVDFKIRPDLNSGASSVNIPSVSRIQSKFSNAPRTASDQTTCTLGGMTVDKDSDAASISETVKKSMRILSVAETFAPPGPLKKAYDGLSGGYKILTKGESLCKKVNTVVNLAVQTQEGADLLLLQSDIDEMYRGGEMVGVSPRDKSDLFAINMMLKFATYTADFASAGTLTPLFSVMRDNVMSGVKNVFDWRQKLVSSSFEAFPGQGYSFRTQINLIERGLSWNSYWRSAYSANFKVTLQPVYLYQIPFNYDRSMAFSKLDRIPVQYGSANIIFNNIDPRKIGKHSDPKDVSAGLYLVTITKVNASGDVVLNSDGQPEEEFRDTLHVTGAEAYPLVIRR
jgi:hypothetical protein